MKKRITANLLILALVLINTLTKETEDKKLEIESSTIPLPEDFRGAKILLTDTDNGFLNIVAFKSDINQCLISMIYDDFNGNKNYQANLSFTDLSTSECLRVRVTRYGRKDETRLISYISDSGLFKWIARRYPNDSNTEWITNQSPNLFEGYINSREYHQVQSVACNSESIDFFYVYQKTADEKSQDSIRKIPFFYSDAELGSTNSSSTLKLKVSKYDYFNLTGLDPNDYELENLNLKSSFDRVDHFGYFLMLRFKETGLYESPYGVIDSNFNLIDNRQYPAFFSYSDKKFAGTANFEGIDGTFEYYYTLKANGEISLCIPKFYGYFNNYSESYLEYSCLVKSLPENVIEEDEFVDSLAVFSKFLVVVILRRRGDSAKIRNLVFWMGEGGNPYDFDFENKLYTSNENNLFEMPRVFPLTEIPVIVIKDSKVVNNEKRRIGDDEVSKKMKKLVIE